MTSSSTLTVALVLAMTAMTSLGCEKKADDPPKPDGAAILGAKTAAATPPIVPIVMDAGPIETIEVPEVRVRKDASTSVRVTWVTPKNTAVNDEAPFRVRWNRSDGLADAPADVKSTGSQVKDGFTVKVQPMANAPNASLTGEINIVVCDSATHSVCVPVKRSLELGFVVTQDAAEQATVKVPLPEARSH